MERNKIVIEYPANRYIVPVGVVLDKASGIADAEVVFFNGNNVLVMFPIGFDLRRVREDCVLSMTFQELARSVDGLTFGRDVDGEGHWVQIPRTGKT